MKPPPLPRLLPLIGALALVAWPGTARTLRQVGTASVPPIARRAPPLGAVPTTCSANPPPTALPHGLGTASGMSPVWVAGFTPGLSLHLGDPHLLAYGLHGWARKLGWVIGPHYHRRVRLRGWTLGTGVPLWFQFGGEAPRTVPILDPQHPQAFSPDQPAGWVGFPSYLYLPRAGCYVVQATWPGGLWQLTFAAGR